MANFRNHAFAGITVGVAFAATTNLLKQQERKAQDPNCSFNVKELITQLLLGGAVGALFGMLPDLLEPATSPRHRKFFHSISAAAALGYGMYKVNTSDLSNEGKELINMAGSAYLSHLALDSDTPFGLPLVA